MRPPLSSDIRKFMTRPFAQLGWLIPMLLMFSGCAVNPFTESYVQSPDRVFDAKLASPVSKSAEVRLVKVADLTDEIVQSAGKQGYVLLGSSTVVRSTPVRESLVLSHAGEIGADLVFIAKTYSHSESGLASVSTYKPGTNSVSTTSGAISVYGNASSALANFNSTTTTTSSGSIETTYVPTTFQFSRTTTWFFGRKNQ